MLSNLKEFFRFINLFSIAHSRSIILLVSGGILMSFMELVGIGLLFPFLLLIHDPVAATKSHFLMPINQFFHFSDPRYFIIFLGFLTAGIFICKNLFYIFYLRYEFKVLSGWRVKLSRLFFQNYINAPYEVHIKRNSSDIINTITGSINYTINNFVRQMLNLFNLALTGLIIIIYIAYAFPGSSVVLLPVTAFILWSHSRVLKNVSQRNGEKIVELSGKQYAVLQQSVKGFKETRIHQKSAFFSNQFYKLNRELSKAEGKNIFFQALPSATIELIVMCMLLATFVSFMFMGNSTGFTFALISSIAFASLRLIPTLNRSVNAISMISSAKAPLMRLFEEAELIGLTKENTNISIDDMDEKVSLSFNKRVRLKNISYRYPDAAKLALDDINMDIGFGEFIGITGPSGGGKTSLVLLLIGFLPPTQGELYFDEQLITSERINALQNIIGYVDQNVFLLNATIAQNIAYGEETHEIDRDRVFYALEKAQLLNLISSLPEGIDTVIGEDGKLFSGGQRQRVSIARALYKKSKLLILDEASAPLDMETEHQFFDFLYSLKGQITVVMIAHRLSTLKKCDRVLFMEEGKIQAAGSFSYLKQNNETFKKYLEYSEIIIDTLDNV